MQARIIAVEIFQNVILKKQNLDEVFDIKAGSLSAQDRAFVRMLVTTTLRRLGQIDDVLTHFLTKQLPNQARVVYDILRLSVCQILFMQTPEFAAVDTAAEMARFYKKEAFVKLVNGVLRNVCRQKESLLENQDEAKLNTPDWLWNSWEKSYGTAQTRRIALANLTEPATYLTCKQDADVWAKKLGGILTSTGSVQLGRNAYVPDLEGFKEGAWWVQDRAAALSVQVFGNLKGKKVADLCAAPGGKTAQLVCQGADVDAFDISANRMQRVADNIKRLGIHANLIVEDANNIEGSVLYDAILLDAPCSATGTIMRHPDLYFHRTPDDITKLNKAQYRLLQTAYRLLKDDGRLVYCTCSLQQQEGENMIEKVSDLFERVTIENPILQPFVTKNGDVRTFPFDQMDGFFISFLKKRCK